MTNPERQLLTHSRGMRDPRSVKILEHVCYFDSSAGGFSGWMWAAEVNRATRKEKVNKLWEGFSLQHGLPPAQGKHTFTHTHTLLSTARSGQCGVTVNSGGAPAW